MTKKKILYVVLYLILLNGLIQTYLLKSEFIPAIADVLIFYVAFTVRNNLRAVNRMVGSFVVALYVLLLVGSTVVAVVNDMPFLSTLWGLRMVLRYLLLFMMVYKYFDANDIAKYKRIIFKFFWINAAVVAFQFFVERKDGDFIGGIFSFNGDLVMFNLFVTFLMSKEYFTGHLKKSRFLWLIAIEMFTAMVAEIKLMYFVIPLAIYAVYIFTKKFRAKHIIILAVAFFCLVPAMKAVMSLMYDENYVTNTFDIDAIEEETSHDYNLSEEAMGLSFNRSTCVEKASAFILRDPNHLMFGYGIGSANTSQIFGTWISAQYSKITSYNWFTPSWLLIEYGWVGYVIWILILFGIVWRFFSIYRRSHDEVLKYWSSLGTISAMFTYILAWYGNLPYFNAYFIYLFWAVCFTAISIRQKALQSGNYEM